MSRNYTPYPSTTFVYVTKTTMATRFFGRVCLPDAATSVVLAGVEKLVISNAALAPESVAGPTTLLV